MENGGKEGRTTDGRGGRWWMACRRGEVDGVAAGRVEGWSGGGGGA